MKNKGITLIALVITIVVLIILAGVAIQLSLGENGILKRAEEAKERESESTAREKLELVLVDARIEKETNTSYNSEDYLTQMLEEENIAVNGNAVVVDNYNFIIDREELEILKSLGETEIKVTAEVQEYLGKNENDKYEVSILVVIESNTGLQSIVIQNPDGSTFEIETQQEILGKDMEVELDEEYIITITTKDGKTEIRKIVEKSEEKIRTTEELVAFRDKVNTGLTYEGKTINVVNDLDLSSVCGESIGSWEPIGNYGTNSSNIFKGIFNGNNNKIIGIYVNNNKNYQGLFGRIQDGTVENLTIQGIAGTSGKYYVGLLAGACSGTIDNVIVTEGSKVSGLSYIGGLVGNSSTKIYNSSNFASINATGIYVGGLCGQSNSYTISRCINKGYVKGNKCVGGIVGDNSVVTESYNEALVEGSSGYVGGICGANGTISYCFNKGNIKAYGDDGTGYSSVGGIVGGGR